MTIPNTKPGRGLKSADVSETTMAVLAALGYEVTESPEDEGEESILGFMHCESGDIVTHPNDVGRDESQWKLKRVAIEEALVEAGGARARREAIREMASTLGSLVVWANEAQVGHETVAACLSDFTDEAYSDGALVLAAALVRFAKPSHGVRGYMLLDKAAAAIEEEIGRRAAARR